MARRLVLSKTEIHFEYRVWIQKQIFVFPYSPEYVVESESRKYFNRRQWTLRYWLFSNHALRYKLHPHQYQTTHRVSLYQRKRTRLAAAEFERVFLVEPPALTTRPCKKIAEMNGKAIMS